MNDQMPRMRNFLKSAYKVFNLEEENRGKQNKRYIPVPAKLSEKVLPPRGKLGKPSKLTNPFIFLSGKWFRTAIPFTGQENAKLPGCFFIVGQYGLGKTELIYQICQYLLEAPNRESVPQPLPINLALCRNELGYIRPGITADDFCHLLFDRILAEAKLNLSFVKSELLPEIHAGRILLLLDGLDELVATNRENRRFLKGLARMLAADPTGGGMTSASEARAVVSMRLEYLYGVSNADDAGDLTDIVNQAQAALKFNTYFLKLDFLEDSRINAYFCQRLTAGNEAFEKVQKNEQLLEMLRRPLLLRIFCDLAERQPKKKFHLLLESLKNQEHPARLLQLFVDLAAHDAILNKYQKKIADFVWDADELAKISVKMYESGKSEMSLTDAGSILKSTDGKAPCLLTESEILDGIHKCPFLLKDVRTSGSGSQITIRFAHKIFYEYFIAKGIALHKDSDNYDPWMNLVLNVDMRKFLKGLVPESEWYERTKKSYAMESEQLPSWRHELNFTELEKERRFFLDFMTDPENEKYLKDEDHSLASTVKRFLAREDQLHPRYLLYTYEAVALYVEYHKWDEEGAEISKDFSEILHKRIQKIIAAFSDEKPDRRAVYALLLERILHIGQRLRYRWIKQYKKNRHELLTLAADDNIKARIKTIFTNVEKSLV